MAARGRLVDEILMGCDYMVQTFQYPFTGGKGNRLWRSGVDLSSHNICIDEIARRLQISIDCRLSGAVWTTQNGAEMPGAVRQLNSRPKFLHDDILTTDDPDELP